MIGDTAVDDSTYEIIFGRLRDGDIIPFFGAGASVACGLPTGSELAKRLADSCTFPGQIGRDDLALVASYLVQKKDSIALRKALREELDSATSPGRLHTLFANSTFGALKLFVTTNYDGLIEQALSKREPWIVVDHGVRGSVWVRPWSKPWQQVEANRLRRLIPDFNEPTGRPVVFKMHGNLERADRNRDTFLITEGDYVDFLGRGEDAIPDMFVQYMMLRSFLFLGYGLRDWNIRVLLSKLQSRRLQRAGVVQKAQSWAVVREPNPVERELWQAQHVEMIDMDFQDFVGRLEANL